MALSGHRWRLGACLLLGVKRTSLTTSKVGDRGRAHKGKGDVDASFHPGVPSPATRACSNTRKRCVTGFGSPVRDASRAPLAGAGLGITI